MIAVMHWLKHAIIVEKQTLMVEKLTLVVESWALLSYHGPAAIAWTCRKGLQRFWLHLHDRRHALTQTCNNCGKTNLDGGETHFGGGVLSTFVFPWTSCHCLNLHFNFCWQYRSQERPHKSSEQVRIEWTADEGYLLANCVQPYIWVEQTLEVVCIYISKVLCT